MKLAPGHLLYVGPCLRWKIDFRSQQGTPNKGQREETTEKHENEKNAKWKNHGVGTNRIATLPTCSRGRFRFPKLPQTGPVQMTFDCFFHCYCGEALLSVFSFVEFSKFLPFACLVVFVRVGVSPRFCAGLISIHIEQHRVADRCAAHVHTIRSVLPQPLTANNHLGSRNNGWKTFWEVSKKTSWLLTAWEDAPREDRTIFAALRTPIL